MKPYLFISVIVVGGLITASNSEPLMRDHPHTHTEMPAHNELQPEPFDGPVTTLSPADAVKPLLLSRRSSTHTIHYVLQR